MKAILFTVATFLLSACATTTPRSDMQSDVEQAASVVERFESLPEKSIPRTIMRAAKGVAILTITKAGFIGSVRGGTGVVVARHGKSWSGPVAISTGGVGFGFQAGVEVSELVIVLNTPAAVDAFSSGGNITLGGNLSAAAGPVGRAAEGGVGIQSAMYTYGRSQGLFAGISIEGTVISVRDDLNEAYYGKPVRARDVLSGNVAVPTGSKRLISVLTKY